MKTLEIDIETFPNLGYAWGKWQQDIIEYPKDHHWYVLCFAYKWFGRREIKTVSLQGHKAGYWDGKDYSVIKKMWELLDEADVVVAHNAKAFDVRKMFTRMVQYGMKPPSKFDVIDTLKEARKFAFNSSKLDEIGRDARLGRKMTHNGFPLWIGCHNAEPKAWTKMLKYNVKDVVLLDKWFKRLIPWIGYLSSKGTPYAKTKKLNFVEEKNNGKV